MPIKFSASGQVAAVGRLRCRLGTFATVPAAVPVAACDHMYATERVDRVMSAALSISVDESAGTMLRLFAGYPIHHLPVVSGRRVVGIVSSADILKLDAFRLKTGVPSNEHLTSVSVADLMSKPAVTIRPHQSLIDAAHLMASHGVHALPVVDADEQLLGILTTTDIITATLQALGTGPVARVADPGCREDAA